MRNTENLLVRTLGVGTLVGGVLLGCGADVDGGGGNAGVAPCSPQALQGVWSMNYEPTGNGCHPVVPIAAKMTLSEGDGGVLLVNGDSNVTLDTATCTLHWTWSSSEVISGELNGEKGDMTLKFQGNQASGTLIYCRYWACSEACDDGDWSVTATR